MSYLNAVLRVVFDALLFPFRGLPPLVGLVVVSLLTAIAMLIVFKKTSNQEGLQQVKRRIHACLFEIRLYNDDLRAIMRAQWELLRTNLSYLGHSLVPMLWMIVPFVLVVAQLQHHYGYGGLEAGEPTLLKVRMSDAWGNGTGAGRPDLSLETPSGVRVETPALWIPSEREMDWRIAAYEPGEHELKLQLQGQVYTKMLQVSDAVVRRSPVKPRSFVDQLLYPAEAPLPKAGLIESISVSYPERGVSVLGVEMPWWLIYLALAIGLAFVLRKPFGVTL